MSSRSAPHQSPTPPTESFPLSRAACV
jgi:hypothetical protein